MKHNINNIAAMLGASQKYCGGRIRCFEEIESTNSWMLGQIQSGRPIDGIICLAETQTAGRGRYGSTWVTPPSGAVAMSIGWRLENKNPQGLSLVSGLAVVRSLQELGVKNIKLKWPNDIVADGAKLGGILVEIADFQCVIGIGINVHIPAGFALPVNQPWVDISSLGYQIDRDRLAAQIILNHERLLGRYRSGGFSGFADKWNALHAYQNRMVDIFSAGGRSTGMALGVDKSGALLIARDGSIHRITSGEVSARPAG